MGRVYIRLTAVLAGLFIMASAVAPVSDTASLAAVTSSAVNKAENAPPLAREQERLEYLFGAASNFKKISMDDYRRALSVYASSAAVERFSELNRRFWDVVDPQTGWAYFFSASVTAFGGVDGEKPLAAFYNPWCDLYLVTVWELRDGAAFIKDVEMLMGDFVRNKGKAPFDIVPMWLRADLFKPESVGAVTARSILKFEEAFAPQGDFGDWRAVLPGLRDRKALEKINYGGARLLLLQNLRNISQYSAPSPGENKRLSILRETANKGLGLASAGKMKTLLATADQTMKEARQKLLEIPPEWFRSLAPVAYYAGGDGGFVFMVPASGAGYCVSFMIKDPKGEKFGQSASGVIKRIDIVVYASVYERMYLDSGGTMTSGESK